MTAAKVLAEVLRSGGRIITDAERPRLWVPAHLKSLVVEHRAELRRLVIQALNGVSATAPLYCLTQGATATTDSEPLPNPVQTQTKHPGPNPPAWLKAKPIAWAIWRWLRGSRSSCGAAFPMTN